jgi:two-component system phosphate regulon sensor histidine kinase PhoR
MTRFSMVWQLFVAFAALILLALGVLGLVAGSSMERAGMQAIEERLRGKAVLVHDLIRGQKPQELQSRLGALHQEFGTRITLIAADGRVLAETDRDDLEALDNHGQRPEIVSAASQPFGMATRYSTTTRRNMMYVARRVSHEDSPVAFVRVALPVADIEAHVANLRSLVWTTAGATAVIALLLAWWLARRLAEPLRELERGAAAIAGGHYGHKVYIERRDELGGLAEAFNQMSQRLAVQFAQLDQDRQQLRAVLGSMIEGVVAVDADSNVLFANERAGELLNFPVSQAAGRKLWEVVRHRPVQDLVQEVLGAVNGHTATLDAAGFSQRSLTVHAARLPGGPVRGAVLVFHDITELRRLERLRQEFVANVSHELKTPLSVIVACVETLQHGAVDDLENRGKFLERIAAQSHRLSSLIVDLLSLARIESGQEALEAHEVSVADAVRRCVERHLERARSKNQCLEAAPPGQQPAAGVGVWADEDALDHILDNLVDNAIKYTPAGGTIQLHWWAENGTCVIEVRDTGIGIAEADLPRVFERFYRADKARSRELGGTGLGLAIVKHLVQAMGGAVRAESSLERGTTFTVILSQPAPASADV